MTKLITKTLSLVAGAGLLITPVLVAPAANAATKTDAKLVSFLPNSTLQAGKTNSFYILANSNVKLNSRTVWVQKKVVTNNGSYWKNVRLTSGNSSFLPTAAQKNAMDKAGHKLKYFTTWSKVSLPAESKGKVTYRLSISANSNYNSKTTNSFTVTYK